MHRAWLSYLFDALRNIHYHYCPERENGTAHASVFVEPQPFKRELKDTSIMTHTIQELVMKERANGQILEVHVSGKLTGNIYQEIEPEINRLIAKNGKVRLFLELKNFDGTTLAGLWNEMLLLVGHNHTIDRVAIVSDRPRNESVINFTQSVTDAKVEYFDALESNKARVWIEEELVI